MTIERRRASSVCVHQNQILLVNLKDPLTGIERLFPPGGEIEKGETPRETAVRETFEETGYETKVLDIPAVASRYLFEWNGKTYDCYTDYFCVQLTTQKRENIDDTTYNLGHEWVDLDKVESILSFDPNISKSVNDCLMLLKNKEK